MCIINVWSAVELLFIVQFLNLWHIYDIDLIIINISDIQDKAAYYKRITFLSFY